MPLVLHTSWCLLWLITILLFSFCSFPPSIWLKLLLLHIILLSHLWFIHSVPSGWVRLLLRDENLIIVAAAAGVMVFIIVSSLVVAGVCVVRRKLKGLDVGNINNNDNNCLQRTAHHYSRDVVNHKLKSDNKIASILEQHQRDKSVTSSSSFLSSVFFLLFTCLLVFHSVSLSFSLTSLCSRFLSSNIVSLFLLFPRFLSFRVSCTLLRFLFSLWCYRFFVISDALSYSMFAFDQVLYSEIVFVFVLLLFFVCFTSWTVSLDQSTWQSVIQQLPD